jgi:molecular chaperone HtpG
LTLIELPGVDGGLAAVGWFAHHEYKGAIPAGALVKGVRVRAGNIQVGDQTILEQIFPESRFNSWTVGEVHVFDRRIVPNGRRDEFEVNAHHANLVNQLSPIGRDVARRCRTSSALRSKLREFELAGKDAVERLAVIEQGAMSEGAQAAEMGRVGQAIARMRKVTDAEAIEEGAREEMSRTIAGIEAELARVSGGVTVDPLDMVAKDKRDAYRQVFNLIYECSVNRVAAKSLVDKIIQRLAA